MELWEFSNFSISTFWNWHRFSPLYTMTLDFATFLSAKSIFQTLYLAVKTIEIYKMQKKKISQVALQVPLFQSGKQKENKCILNCG